MYAPHIICTPYVTKTISFSSFVIPKTKRSRRIKKKNKINLNSIRGANMKLWVGDKLPKIYEVF